MRLSLLRDSYIRTQITPIIKALQLSKKYDMLIADAEAAPLIDYNQVLDNLPENHINLIQ